MCPVHRRRRWSKTLAIFLWWADCERHCETCIAVGTGSAVILKACHASSPSQWEAQGSGARLTTPRGFICYACARSDQLRLSGADRNRSSMKGLAVGTNVASESAILASSSSCMFFDIPCARQAGWIQESLSHLPLTMAASKG
jgi:hypothetical protein